MSNELLFLIQTIIGLTFTLLAFSMGRNWLYGYIILPRIFTNAEALSYDTAVRIIFSTYALFITLYDYNLNSTYYT